ncbi:MAG: amino acid adenylation domain-containing protein [Bacteroidota bacterium]
MRSLSDSSITDKTKISFAPATEAQQEVWISCIVGGDNANRAYNLSVSLTLTGNLDQSCLEKCLQEEINRHEALRSTFTEDGAQVRIESDGVLQMHFEDLSSLAPVQKDSALDNYIRTQINVVFDLLNGPLYQLSLFRIENEKHILVFTIHHLVCDGWSMGLFLEELGSNYTTCIKGQTSTLDEPVSFQEYAHKQQTFTQSDDYKQIERFWLNEFKDSIPILELPLDGVRPAIRTTKSERYDIVMDAGLLGDIKSLASKTRCSLAIILRAVFEVFLYKITKQNDIVLGLPTAGQAATGNYSLMSHCINFLPLRSRLGEDTSFSRYLNTRKNATLEAYDNQLFTFGSLLKKLNVSRDPSRLPLVSIVFSIDMGIGDAVKFDDMENSLFSNKRDYENFEIFVNATDTGQNFVLEWTYNTQLFKRDSIKQMMAEFVSMLHTVVHDPETSVYELAGRNENHYTESLADWNETTVSYPANTPVHEFVSRNAKLYPDKAAIKIKNSEVSYSDLEAQTNRLAAYLIDLGIRGGDRIAIAMDRSLEMVISLLAIMKTGAAYIPVDPEYPKTRIEYMLSDSAAKALLTSADYKGQFVNGNINEIVFEEIAENLINYPSIEQQVTINGDDLAYIIYTSGSTGQPKGIAIEHHSLTNFLCSMQKAPGISAEDKLLAVTTISFDISGLELYLPLISGAQLILADAEDARDGREIIDLLKNERITVMQATPSTWRMMVETGWDDKLNLKALCGGEALPQDLAELLLERCDQVWNMYGPTETTIWSSVKRITDSTEIITVGRPIDNTKIFILDEDLHVVLPGNTGEIYISGDGLAREYWNQPELTQKSFISTTIDAGVLRIYRTGDLGKFLPNGEIQCFGRIDNQVKVRGYRIELGAIESALNSLEAVGNCVVSAYENRPGDQRLVAYIVPLNPDSHEHSESGKTLILTPEEVLSWKTGLKELLPAYMVPGEYVGLPSIPTLPNGKIDRKALPKPNNIVQGRLSGQKPASENEKLVTDIWKEFLKLDYIGLHDDFFELGGHSLTAVQVMIRLEKETGRKLPLTSLFKHSVLGAFAELLEALPVKAGSDPVQQQSEEGSIKPDLPVQSQSAGTQTGKPEIPKMNKVLPRTDLEKMVANIWAELLGVESVGVYDDFFELGGHSLIAMQVMTHIEKQTGKRLPLASFFESSTVESLALMLQMDSKSITWDSLVPIRTEGNKMPLYIVHGAGLNVLFFNTLAKNMDSEQPVYGLQAKGLNGIDEPLEKIEDMAAFYISEILKKNPRGPYALAGFSFGGIIAFEMAKQLKAMNKDVKMLAMFDTYAYQSDRYDGFAKKVYTNLRYLTKQILYTATLYKEDPKRTIEYKTEAIKRRFIQLYWKFRFGKDQNQEGFFGYANKIDIKNVQAWEKYVFTPYNGSIELFRAQKKTFYMDDFEYLGWKPLALKGVRIHEIPGEHNYIFAPPNDKEFAKILQACLDNAVRFSSK